MSPASPILPGFSLSASPKSVSGGSDRARLAVAAKQFEAIFIRQVLSAARQAGLGDNLFGGDGIDTFRQMQDEHFADLAAERGAFGIAAAIERQLAARLGPEER